MNQYKMKFGRDNKKTMADDTLNIFDIIVKHTYT